MFKALQICVPPPLFLYFCAKLGADPGLYKLQASQCMIIKSGFLIYIARSIQIQLLKCDSVYAGKSECNLSLNYFLMICLHTGMFIYMFIGTFPPLILYILTYKRNPAT